MSANAKHSLLFACRRSAADRSPPQFPCYSLWTAKSAVIFARLHPFVRYSNKTGAMSDAALARVWSMRSRNSMARPLCRFRLRTVMWASLRPMRVCEHYRCASQPVRWHRFPVPDSSPPIECARVRSGIHRRPALPSRNLRASYRRRAYEFARESQNRSLDRSEHNAVCLR